MTQKYAFKDYDKETMARAAVLSASVSTKHCIEILKAIKGKDTKRAKSMLEDVISMKKAIPFTRFMHNVGHKRGIGPGRYPVKACKEVLALIKVCEANAQFKGINSDSLRIRHACANLASRPWHFGRARRRQMKRTHMELVLEEIEKKKPEKKAKAKADEKATEPEADKKPAEKDKPEEKEQSAAPKEKEAKPEQKGEAEAEDREKDTAKDPSGKKKDAADKTEGKEGTVSKTSKKPAEDKPKKEAADAEKAVDKDKKTEQKKEKEEKKGPTGTGTKAATKKKAAKKQPSGKQDGRKQDS